MPPKAQKKKVSSTVTATFTQAELTKLVDAINMAVELVQTAEHKVFANINALVEEAGYGSFEELVPLRRAYCQVREDPESEHMHFDLEDVLRNRIEGYLQTLPPKTYVGVRQDRATDPPNELTLLVAYNQTRTHEELFVFEDWQVAKEIRRRMLEDYGSRPGFLS